MNKLPMTVVKTSQDAVLEYIVGLKGRFFLRITSQVLSDFTVPSFRQVVFFYVLF